MPIWFARTPARRGAPCTTNRPASAGARAAGPTRGDRAPERGPRWRPAPAAAAGPPVPNERTGLDRREALEALAHPVRGRERLEPQRIGCRAARAGGGARPAGRAVGGGGGS